MAPAPLTSNLVSTGDLTYWEFVIAISRKSYDFLGDQCWRWVFTRGSGRGFSASELGLIRDFNCYEYGRALKSELIDFLTSTVMAGKWLPRVAFFIFFPAHTDKGITVLTNERRVCDIRTNQKRARNCCALCLVRFLINWRWRHKI